MVLWKLNIFLRRRIIFESLPKTTLALGSDLSSELANTSRTGFDYIEEEISRRSLKRWHGHGQASSMIPGPLIVTNHSNFCWPMWTSYVFAPLRGRSSAVLFLGALLSGYKTGIGGGYFSHWFSNESFQNFLCAVHLRNVVKKNYCEK